MLSTTQPSTLDLQPATNWWQPTAGLTWQWQIVNMDIDTSIEADVYDIDLYVDQAIVDELHAKGRKVICYMSVGSREDWRPDKDNFPAEESHQCGLAIGHKNASDQVSQLVYVYDFAITEDYFYCNEAEKMLPYIAANKPVFAAEYTDLPGDSAVFCKQSKQLNYSTILKKRGLDAWLETCP